MRLKQAPRWDDEADVVVVGFGAAGAVAAIEAADHGADVILCEKMAFPGGLSAISAGGIRVTNAPEQAFDYLRATCGGRTPDDVLRVLAEGMAAIPDYIRSLARVCAAEVSVYPAMGNYPLPGCGSLSYCEVTNMPAIEGGDRFHATDAVRNGARLFAVLLENVLRRGVPVRYRTRAQRLVTDHDGGVLGVVVLVDEETRYIRARRGVILSCGGFENDAEMQTQYLQATPILPGSFSGNTGDGVRMAQAVGADLWHMWHYHGPYGMRDPQGEYPFALYLKNLPMWTPEPVRAEGGAGGLGGGSDGRVAPMAWILVDQTGRRFMDEYPPYPGDTGVRPFDHFDPKTQSFPRNPAFVLFDDPGRRMYPLGGVAYNDDSASYQWSEDNSEEISRGLFTRADDVATLSALMDVDVSTLAETLENWNHAVETGVDEDFGRHPRSMVPIRTPPFYFGRVHPVVINTQGGPRHNIRQQVLDPFGSPIRGLYAAGELGSVFGHLYLAGGNLAECVVGGRIAGREAATVMPEDQLQRSAS